MKILKVFSLIFVFYGLLVFTGCTSTEHQQLRNERERLRAAYEEARIKNDRQSVKDRLERKMLGTWQFLDIEVLESDLSNEIASARMALIKSRRKNLTIRFFEANGIRFYKGENGGPTVTGEFGIKVERIAEVLYPKLAMNQGTGVTAGEFLLDIPGIFKAGLGTPNVLVAVEDDRLYLTVGAGVSPTPTPEGWAHSDGTRFSFKRIK